VLAEMRDRKLPTPTLYDDHRKMLESGYFDAVSICTPSVHHAPIFLDCVSKVPTILLEKPMPLICHRQSQCKLLHASMARR